LQGKTERFEENGGGAEAVEYVEQTLLGELDGICEGGGNENECAGWVVLPIKTQIPARVWFAANPLRGGTLTGKAAPVSTSPS